MELTGATMKQIYSIDFTITGAIAIEAESDAEARKMAVELLIEAEIGHPKAHEIATGMILLGDSFDSQGQLSVKGKKL